jgi:hypothetical protein
VIGPLSITGNTGTTARPASSPICRTRALAQARAAEDVCPMGAIDVVHAAEK